jgi:hypothetical protein
MKLAADKCTMVTNAIRFYDKGDLNPSWVRVELEIPKSSAQRQREYRRLQKFNFLNSVTSGGKSQW